MKVHRIGIGTGRLASLGSGYSRKDALALFTTAANLGINIIDTADSYGSTDCERLIGDLLAHFPKHFIVGTKAGYRFCELPIPFGFLNQFGKKARSKLGAHPSFETARIRRCIDGSLRRLRIERLEYFLLHDPPSAVWEGEEFRTMMEQAKKGGKIHLFGISTSDMRLAALADSDPLVDLLQMPVNPLFPAFNPVRLGIIANQVFGAGRLLKLATPFSRILYALAQRYQATPREILIAYAAGRPGVRCVLSGTGRAAHLRENTASLGITLDESDVRTLENATMQS